LDWIGLDWNCIGKFFLEEIYYLCLHILIDNKKKEIMEIRNHYNQHFCGLKEKAVQLLEPSPVKAERHIKGVMKSIANPTPYDKAYGRANLLIGRCINSLHTIVTRPIIIGMDKFAKKYPKLANIIAGVK